MLLHCNVFDTIYSAQPYIMLRLFLGFLQARVWSESAHNGDVMDCTYQLIRVAVITPLEIQC